MNDLKCVVESAKKEIVSSLLDEINQLHQTIRALTNRLRTVELKFESISNENIIIKNDLSKIQEELSNQDNMKIDPEVMAQEIEQRLLRKDNIIIHGVPEVTEGTIDERMRKEDESVRNVCTVLNVENPVVKDFHRIGKGSNDRPRLLKVTCDERTRRELLKKTRLLRTHPFPFNKIYIHIDRTRMQQEIFKAKPRGFRMPHGPTAANHLHNDLTRPNDRQQQNFT